VVFIGGVRCCSSRRLGAGGPLVRPAGHATWSGTQVSSLHLLWALDTLSIASAGHVDKTVFGNTPTHGRPAKVMWPVSHTLARLIPCFVPHHLLRVIFSVTMSYFGHNEDMHGFWSIWCFSIIWCSWNGRSTKLVKLVSNKHLSSISWMKCRYVHSKYMHFMIANNPVDQAFFMYWCIRDLWVPANLVASTVVELDSTPQCLTDVHWDSVGATHGCPLRYRVEDLH
jgi:hypothetical protein